MSIFIIESKTLVHHPAMLKAWPCTLVLSITKFEDLSQQSIYYSQTFIYHIGTHILIKFIENCLYNIYIIMYHEYLSILMHFRISIDVTQCI